MVSLVLHETVGSWERQRAHSLGYKFIAVIYVNCIVWLISSPTTSLFSVSLLHSSPFSSLKAFLHITGKFKPTMISAGADVIRGFMPIQTNNCWAKWILNGASKTHKLIIFLHLIQSHLHVQRGTSSSAKFKSAFTLWLALNQNLSEEVDEFSCF